MNVDNNYSDLYQDIECIGSGSFGVVYKTRQLIDNELMAVKKIILIDDDLNIGAVSKEISNMAKISGNNIVQMKQWFMEKDNANIIFYIFMELCEDNFSSVLKIKPDIFKRSGNKKMSIIEFFISCEFLKEIVECVLYLHNLNPPVLHRDLKPQNILITRKHAHGKFFKLCDFGLATTQENSSVSLTSGVGTVNYRSPESETSHYNTKTDVYSLGFIAQDIFEIDIHKDNPVEIYEDDDLKQHFVKIDLLINKMVAFPEFRNRPSCKEVLRELQELSIVKDNMECNLSDIIEQGSIKDDLYLFIKEYIDFKLIKININ